MNEQYMYAYRVYCNRSLIASFRTQAECDRFIAERRVRFPQNHYGEYPKFD